MLRCRHRYQPRTYFRSVEGQNVKLGAGRVLTHHGPHVVAHSLANGTTHEDYICDSEYEPAANVARQGARPEPTKKSAECRCGSDQFLWRGGP